MSKKLFIGLVPLLATAAFVVMPAVAQAAESSTGQSSCVKASKCHWYVGLTSVSNNSPAPETEGVAIPTLSWGTLSLTDGAGTISCQNAVLGEDENPVGGGPGRGETENFATADCEAAGCNPPALEGMVTAEDLPWANVLEERGTAGSGKGLHPLIRLKTYKASATETSPEGYALSPVGAQVTTRCTIRPGGPPGYKFGSETPGSEGWASIVVQSGGGTAKQGAEFEIGETARQEVGAPGLANGYKGFNETGKPSPEPGRPPIINVPGAPISICAGASAPLVKVGSGAGTNAGHVEFDQPATGVLTCNAPYGNGETTGEVTAMGYNGEELINAF